MKLKRRETNVSDSINYKKLIKTSYYTTIGYYEIYCNYM